MGLQNLIIQSLNKTSHMDKKNALATTTATQHPSIFTDQDAFAFAQRTCQALIQSEAIPKMYQKNLPNALVAFEYANRLGASILEVMQNLDIIQGKPSFSSKYVAARVNTCGKFSELEYEFKELGERDIEYSYTEWNNNTKSRKTSKIKVQDRSCVAFATNLKTGKILRSETISIEMAVKEGWYTKDGSKWQTMPMLMLQYRAAKFFQNQYAPELMYGFPSTDEVIDITYKEVVPGNGEPTDLNVQVVKTQATSTAESTTVDKGQAGTTNEASPSNQHNHDDELM